MTLLPPLAPASPHSSVALGAAGTLTFLQLLQGLCCSGHRPYALCHTSLEPSSLSTHLHFFSCLRAQLNCHVLLEASPASLRQSPHGTCNSFHRD